MNERLLVLILYREGLRMALHDQEAYVRRLRAERDQLNRFMFWCFVLLCALTYATGLV